MNIRKWVSGACLVLPSLVFASTTTTFSYTGAMQTYTVPAGVTSVTIEAWGAQGGTNSALFNANSGGYAAGTLTVSPGETLRVYVGGQGTVASGGFNGGGAGDNAGAGGGGASDVRRDPYTLADRVMVAGGGGGGGVWSGLNVIGGIGGGLNGGDGNRDGVDPGGKGASQSGPGASGTCGSLNNPVTAGSLGQGGTAAGQNCGCDGYGGGGGYYGGAGDGNCRGGGGGSGYLSSLLSNTLLTAGLRSGNGEVRIISSGPVAAVPVPTLGEWALLLLIGLTPLTAAVSLRRSSKREG